MLCTGSLLCSLVATLRQIITLHAVPAYFFKTYHHLTPPTYPQAFQVISFFHSVFSNRNLQAYLFLFSMRATYPSYLILLYFITRMSYVENYESGNSTLFNFLQPPVTSYRIGSNICLSTLLPDVLSQCFPLMSETKFRAYIEQQQHYSRIYQSLPVLDCKQTDENSRLNGSKHSLNLIYFSFLHTIRLAHRMY